MPASQGVIGVLGYEFVKIHEKQGENQRGGLSTKVAHLRWLHFRTALRARPQPPRPALARDILRSSNKSIFVSPDFTRYRAVSRNVHEIFKGHTDLIEPLSLDEAYLDVTQIKTGLPTATFVAHNS